MNRTDQAHQWTVYFVLALFAITVCGVFAFTDKLDTAAFIGIAGMIFTFFFQRPKPDSNSAASNGHPQPPTP